MEDIRIDCSSAGAGAAAAVNGNKKVNGEQQQSTAPLAVPRSAIEEALRVTREALETVCEIEESGAS